MTTDTTSPRYYASAQAFVGSWLDTDDLLSAPDARLPDGQWDTRAIARFIRTRPGCEVLDRFSEGEIVEIVSMNLDGWPMRGGLVGALQLEAAKLFPWASEQECRDAYQRARKEFGSWPLSKARTADLEFKELQRAQAQRAREIAAYLDASATAEAVVESAQRAARGKS